MKFVLMKSIQGACTRIIHIIYNRITSDPNINPHTTLQSYFEEGSNVLLR